MEDREIAQGGLSVENGCFEEMWWADSGCFCEMVSSVFHFSWADASKPTYFLYAVFYKLISILIDFAQFEWRVAGDQRSDGARPEPDWY